MKPAQIKYEGPAYEDQSGYRWELAIENGTHDTAVTIEVTGSSVFMSQDDARLLAKTITEAFFILDAQ